MFVSSNLLKELLPYFKRKLKGIYPDEEIESLFFFTCFHQHGLSKYNSLHDDKRLTESELLFFRDVVTRLAAHEPIQYILGKTTFYDLIFEVGPGVLIPRPETEELVDIIIKAHASQPKMNVLDVGTGSGCIAVSLAKNLNHSNITAIDVSEDALVIAKKNAELNNVSVLFLKSDVLHEDLKALPELDLIVSNPPYIPAAEKESMSKHVVMSEPSIALFVDDSDPLIFYRKIAELGKDKLRTGGHLYFEVHYLLGGQVADLLESNGFREIELLNDMSGADRFVRAQK